MLLGSAVWLHPWAARRRRQLLEAERCAAASAAEMERGMLKVEPFPFSIGADVSGIDLRQVPSTEVARELRKALAARGLLLFRRQSLEGRHVLQAGRVFGEPALPHDGAKFHLMMYMVKDREQRMRGSDFWHSDHSYKEVPGGPTCLYALRVPRDADGTSLGDTEFLDVTAAAAELPRELRARVEGRCAAHSLAHNGGHPAEGGQAAEEEPPAVHPVLRVNPLNGREAIYVSQGYTRRIEGVSAEASRALLEALFAHLQQARYRLRHSWCEGDFLVWDNGRLQHRAMTMNLPQGSERAMYRLATHGPGLRDDDGGAPP